MSENIQLESMEKLFLALSDQTRLRLLNLMREDEICVCFFTEALGESQPKISRHLAYLRKSGLVRSRREGKWMHYQINFPEDTIAREILVDTLEWLASNEEMQKEHRKLIEVCCSLDVPVTISKAPKPDKLVQLEEPAQEREELETFLL